MRAKWILCMLLGCLLIVSTASAQESSTATQAVSVEVTENIAVDPGPAPTMPTSFNIGEPIVGTIPFEVHGNTQFVDMTVAASCLYKGNAPGNIHVIPVDNSSGPRLYPDAANLDGSSFQEATLAWDSAQVITVTPNQIATDGSHYTEIADGVDLGGGFIGNVSETGTFESNQGGVFSQPVLVDVTWVNDNAQLPTGIYGGLVKLTAVVIY